MSIALSEISQRKRFEFGKNWSHFLSSLNEDRIQSAEKKLQDMLEMESLTGLSFIDVGSGSGLSSLAARRLGAKVHSFDYDPNSVECTKTLKQRYFPEDPDWTIEEGSALDTDYVRSLGTYDIVYSWGVLHHTGNMWMGLDNVVHLLKPFHSVLYLSIYNDQGYISVRWRKIKRLYNRLPPMLRTPYALLIGIPMDFRFAINPLYFLRPKIYMKTWRHAIQNWTNYQNKRGMSRWHDLIDWVGGYPFEVAKPEEIFEFYKKRGLALKKLYTCGGGLGCNEYVFERPQQPSSE